MKTIMDLLYTIKKTCSWVPNNIPQKIVKSSKLGGCKGIGVFVSLYLDHKQCQRD